MIINIPQICILLSQRSSPSSEIVMIDRTFNQEERNTLTQDKRMVLVDPGKNIQLLFKYMLTLIHFGVMTASYCFVLCVADGFLEEFCCGPKKMTSISGGTDSIGHEEIPSLMETSPSQDTPHIQGYGERTQCHIKPTYRTEAYSAFEDPGGGETFSKSSLDMKKMKSNNISSSSSSSQHHQHFHPAHYSTSPSRSQHSSGHFYPSEQLQSFDHGHIQLSDTDSVLEAAVNSILDC